MPDIIATCIVWHNLCIIINEGIEDEWIVAVKNKWVREISKEEIRELNYHEK